MAHHAINKFSRTGVYGIVVYEEKILLITQKSGPWKGRLDLPGGGIEHGETVEAALHREFLEEVGMSFEVARPIANWTSNTLIPARLGKPEMNFHRIGLIYNIEGLSESSQKDPQNQLAYSWYDLGQFNHLSLSPFALRAFELLTRDFCQETCEH